MNFTCKIKCILISLKPATSVALVVSIKLAQLAHLYSLYLHAAAVAFFLTVIIFLPDFSVLAGDILIFLEGTPVALNLSDKDRVLIAGLQIFESSETWILSFIGAEESVPFATFVLALTSLIQWSTI